jgi:hypothetical protein
MNSVNESDARVALIDIGITPNPELIRNWLRAHAPEENEDGAPVAACGLSPGTNERRTASSVSVEGERQTPSSKSRLEPVLRKAGQLALRPGPKKPGRPRIIASWFEKVAQTMADGTSLKSALAMNGLRLSRSEVRACYRNRTLKAMYQEARRCFLAEHYGRKPTLRAKISRYM